MIETLKYWDTNLFLKINGFNNPFLDKVMWLLSNDFFIYPFIAAFLFWLFKKIGGKQTAIALLGIGFCIATSDLTSNFAKHNVKRYRPSHNLIIKDKVHSINGYKGGNYGFYSAHASNTFAIICLLFLFAKELTNNNKWYLVFLLPAIISYSRIYLGVHYPSDVFVGAVIGINIGFLVKYLLKKYFRSV
ncbi:MAG: phosphatase PAP2 family protein [Bacteroidia bacterium]|nr:phosphatase PAP2 family protein [Bacteroidia bacterium]